MIAISVESILFSKYLMYRTVYWHRQVRSATAMIKKAVLRTMEAEFLSPNELYNLDDQSFFTLMERKKNPDHAEAKKDSIEKEAGKEEILSLIQSVRDGRLYIPAAEFSFDEKIHGKLLEIKNRSELEKSLAESLSSALGEIQEEKLIIDIPEPISFESSLYVADEGCFFSDSSSTFKSEMINTLVKSLRIIRIFIEPGYYPEEKNTLSTRKKILQITQKWLHY